MINLTFNSKNILRNTIIKKKDSLFETKSTKLRYRKIGESTWVVVEGTAMSVPDTSRIVHTVYLNDLNPNEEYEFQIVGKPFVVYLTNKDKPTDNMIIHWQTPKPLTNYTTFYEIETYKFRTLPMTLTDQHKIVQISDTHAGDWHIDQMFKWIGEHEPLLIIHSGDVATGNGGHESGSLGSWYTYFRSLNNLKTPDDFLIPVLYNLGNHETSGGTAGVYYGDHSTGIKPNFEEKTRGDTEWYYSFFPELLEQSYYNVVAGDYLSVWQLDPGISTPIDEGQDVWLENTLELDDSPNKFVSLHYTPWSAGRRPDVEYTLAVRNELAPIWEEHDVIVFFGHDHVWSISPRIKGGTLENSGIDNENGVYYLGSGTVGRGTREGRNPKTKWWIDESIPSIILRFPFEKEIGQPEYREPHEDDNKEYEWEEGSHYWVVNLGYNQKTIEAYNGFNNKFYEKTIENK